MAEYTSPQIRDLKCPECGAGHGMLSFVNKDPPEKEQIIRDLGGGIVGKVRFRIKQGRDSAYINPRANTTCAKCGHRETADAFLD